MMFKNAIKLLCTNFDKVWKLLVYHILSIGITFGLLAVFYKDYISIGEFAFNKAEMGSVINTGTLYGSSLAKGLTNVANFVIIFFEEMFTANVGIGVYFCIIVFVIFPLLMNMGKYVVCEMIYGYMSSCRKQSFTATYLKTLKSSLAYSTIKVIFSLPFNLLVVLSMWGLTRVNNQIFDYFMPFVFVIAPALLLALKEEFNCGWAPAKVVYNHNIISSFTIGTRVVLRRGARVFSTSFVIYLLTIVLSMILGIYSIIIILPILFPLLYIQEMVTFFSSQGMRFYVDTNSIISPKKLEEVDKIEDAKYLL